MNDTLHQNRDEWSIQWFVFVDIWCVELCVCFWPLSFTRSASSSTVGLFSSVSACFSLAFWCLWSMLPVLQIYLIMYPFFCLLFIFKYFARIFRALQFLNSYKFVCRVLFLLLNACCVTGVSSLHQELLFTIIIFAFIKQTQKIYRKLNIVYFI